ncbi:unnamed protein product [Closterium sp. NIES-53]
MLLTPNFPRCLNGLKNLSCRISNWLRGSSSSSSSSRSRSSSSSSSSSSISSRDSSRRSSRPSNSSRRSSRPSNSSSSSNLRHLHQQRTRGRRKRRSDGINKKTEEAPQGASAANKQRIGTPLVWKTN